MHTGATETHHTRHCENTQEHKSTRAQEHKSTTGKREERSMKQATKTTPAPVVCGFSPVTLTASVGFTGLPSVEVAKFGFHGARTKLGIVPTMLSQAVVNSLLMREGGPAARQQRLRLRAKGRHVPFHARRPGWALDDSAWTRSTRMTAPRHRQGGW